MTQPFLTELKTWSPRPAIIVGWAVLAVGLSACYWQVFGYLFHNWCQEDYQHGFFVPLFAVWLLIYRRESFPAQSVKGSWWGLAFIAIAALMSFTSAYFAFLILLPLSLLPCILGLVVLIGGWRVLLWAWPSLVFLIFMYPLPGFVEDQFRYQLQRAATVISAFLLQTCGIPVPPPEGNVISLPGGPMEVETACSGLRMMMLFFAVCLGGAFVMRRPLWQKIVVVLSAFPIAIVSNVARITATGLLQERFGIPHDKMGIVHDYAGIIIMMPLALLCLWGELALLGNLFIEPESGHSRMLRQSLGVAPAGPAIPVVAPKPRKRR
jgi:exosortase